MFELIGKDASSRARRGRLTTGRGDIETPAFMPVGTRATVTGLSPDELVGLGAPILLANTYHLLLRPGPELFRRIRRPLEDLRDLVERYSEHVVQHEGEPLGGRQRLQHDKQRNSDRVRE